jgi:hypothetical protein
VKPLVRRTQLRQSANASDARKSCRNPARYRRRPARVAHLVVAGCPLPRSPGLSTLPPAIKLRPSFRSQA